MKGILRGAAVFCYAWIICFAHRLLHFCIMVRRALLVRRGAGDPRVSKAMAMLFGIWEKGWIWRAEDTGSA